MGLLKTETAVIEACAIARDVQSFDLLIEDMEVEMGERWGGLNFDDGLAFLASPEGAMLEFIAIAVDQEDEADITTVSTLIKTAKDVGVKIVLVAHDLSPMGLHQLLRMGADDFTPYPLPENALHDAIERLRATNNAPAMIATSTASGEENRNGIVLPVHGLAGGVGATMFTVNLAWELSLIAKDIGQRICILDLNFQYGTVSTYLDLPRRESIYELLSDTSSMDDDVFNHSLQSYGEYLDVFTAPAEALPLEIVEPDDVTRIIDKARELYDFVLVDMPQTLVHWSETVLQASHVYFALVEMEMRSAQNALRFTRALKAEDLPIEKVRFILNRAPKFTDIAGKGRVKRMAENLNIDLDTQLPDGGKQILNICDHGAPIEQTQPKNPLRKEIAKLAKSIAELNPAQAAATA